MCPLQLLFRHDSLNTAPSLCKNHLKLGNYLWTTLYYPIAFLIEMAPSLSTDGLRSEGLLADECRGPLGALLDDESSVEIESGTVPVR